MEYLVKSPGTCGELVQGRIDGTDFLVTCPINRFSYAVSRLASHRVSAELPAKAKKAVDVTLRYLNKDVSVQLFLFSELTEGKGMASSSADISAVCQATALATGENLSLRELASLALSIEPSDAAFHPGIVQFDHLTGTIMEPLGNVPELRLTLFDHGGHVDTMTFNSRNDLITIRNSNEKYIMDAMRLLREGITECNPKKIGKAATISAFANQEIIYRPYLDKLSALVDNVGAYGIVIAHSGTVCGILSEIHLEEEIRKIVSTKFRTSLRYLDTVSLYNEGIDYIYRE